MGIKKGVLIGLLVIFLLPLVIAEEPDKIIVNSEDWRDVYSTMLYGNLAGEGTAFLVSDRHATLILGTIPKESHIWVIQSKDSPYVVGYRNLLISKGYTAEEFVYDNTNLALGEQLEDITNFIILDDSYGYNAVSVAPYAVVSKSYVLFADRDNIDDVVDFLDGRTVNSILIYGFVDREVKEALQGYNPEIIDKEGDRFLNNIEIVKKYMAIKGTRQVILTNGEFIEQEIMDGAEPVIFIGTNNVPTSVRDYIQDSDIDVGVLIGNELVGTATFIKRQIGISVFVKFAQGARNPKGAVSQVEALDMFYLPVYNLNLEIDSIKYNDATNQLEVTIRNTQDLAAYFIGTYSLSGSDGTKQTVGDADAVFIDGNGLKTVVYDMDPMPEGDISAEVFVIYGESRGSLEKEIRGVLQVNRIKVLDECEIDVDNIDVMFNKGNQNFYVYIENIGETDCYVDVELVDVIVAGTPVTYGMGGAEMISPGDKKKLRINSEMEEADIADNPNVKVRGYYGERENSLIKRFEIVLPLMLEGVDYVFYSLLVIIIILILLIIWKRARDKKKKGS